MTNHYVGVIVYMNKWRYCALPIWKMDLFIRENSPGIWIFLHFALIRQIEKSALAQFKG